MTAPHTSRQARRRTERMLLTAAAVWNAALAIITLFPYQMWFTSAGYAALEAGEALGSVGAVNEVAGIIRLYGILLLAGALLTAVIAWRLPQRHSSPLAWWMAACVVGTLLTRDVVSVLLFSVCLTVYLSRSRALARLAAEPAPARAGETPSPKGGREWIPRT